LGVDDDELLCDLADPTLSSVNVDPSRIGYEAAGLLDRMMAGKQAPGRMVLVPPSEISTRKSTDGLAIEDSEVARALNFIRRHACSGINVQDVLGAVTLSRRILEERFTRLVGRTPHQEIVRLQVQLAKELVGGTDLAMHVIAGRAGFRHVEYLSVVFKREVGVSPTEYRDRQDGR
jgi:LacI family transcriptional regulator